MKFELDVVRFNVNDIVTASQNEDGCANPELPTELGGDYVECSGAFVG